MATVTDTTPATSPQIVAEAPPREETDGFHLFIDALKLNGIDTIFGLPGIPITDLTRKAQAAGLRVISFRHEQNAGNAAAIAGFMTQKPGICLTVSAPGFLNGLTALANATTNCFPMILVSGSSEREVVDLQQGDYEEMDQLAIAKPLCKAAFRVLHAEDIGVGVARAIRAAVSGRPGGVYLDLPAKLFPQAMDAEAGRKSLIKVVDPAPRQIPAPEAVQRALELLKSAKTPAHPARQGRRLRPGRRGHSRPRREDRHPLPADVHGQGPAAGHARAVRFRRALLRAAGGRRGPADRRAPELAALARQGQDLGRQGRQGLGRPEVHPGRHLAAGGGQQRADRRAARRRHRVVRGRTPGRHRFELDQAAGGVARCHRRAQGEERREDVRDAREEPGADELPQRAQRGARHRQGQSRTRFSSTRAPTRSTSRAASSTCTSRGSAWTSAPGA